MPREVGILLTSSMHGLKMPKVILESHVKKKIFKGNTPLDYEEYEGSYGVQKLSESSTEKASFLRSEVHLKGEVKFFEGSLQSNIENKIKDNFYAFNLDDSTVVTKEKISLQSYDHSVDLIPQAKSDLKNKSPEWIRENMGDFYAVTVIMGARARRKVDVYTDSKETDDNIEAEITGSVDKIAWKGTGNIKVDAGWSSLGTSSRTTASFEVVGAKNSSIFLSYDKDDAGSWDEHIRTWRDFVQASPKSTAEAVGFVLKPLWHLVENFDVQKAGEMRNYYRGLWDQEKKERDRWIKEQEERAEKTRRPSRGFLKHYSTGMCVTIKGGGHLDKHDLVLSRNCQKEWRALPENQNQRKGGFYVLEHETGKCVHPWSGWDKPVWGTDLKIYDGCTRSKKKLKWRVWCSEKPGWYILQHWDNGCMVPEGKGAHPGTKVEVNGLGGGHACQGRDKKLFFGGLDFGNDLRC